MIQNIIINKNNNKTVLTNNLKPSPVLTSHLILKPSPLLLKINPSALRVRVFVVVLFVCLYKL